MPTHSYTLRVTEVIHETPDAHSFVLEPAEADRGEFHHRPGQFLTLRIPTDRAEGAARCYSLCSSPDLDEPLRITVKRTRDGYASNWLCDNVVAGDEVEVLPPAGTFTPKSLDGDFLLFAGGSGITPVLSILVSALTSGTGRITLVYANRDEQSVIFRDRLRELEQQFPDRLHVVHLLESLHGLPRPETLQELATPYADRHVFVCGPTAFMETVSAAVAMAGVPGDRVHHEKFLSLGNDPFSGDPIELDTDGPTSSLQVTLDGETRELTWPRGNKLLDVLLAAGLDAPYSCREGQCSACACFVLEGSVEMLHNEVLEAADLADGLVLGCQSIPTSDHVVVSYEE